MWKTESRGSDLNTSQIKAREKLCYVFNHMHKEPVWIFSPTRCCSCLPVHACRHACLHTCHCICVYNMCMYGVTEWQDHGRISPASQVPECVLGEGWGPSAGAGWNQCNMQVLRYLSKHARKKKRKKKKKAGVRTHREWGVWPRNSDLMVKCSMHNLKVCHTFFG